MARGATFSSSLKAIDAFGKTLDDVKVRTRTGAFLTFASITVIIILTLVEWIDYRSVYLDTDIVVDKIRDERITVSMNITFPRVPCFLLSIDVTDASGEHVRDISHNILKTRLSNIGEPVVGAELTSDLRNDVEKVGKTREKGFCGSCYGGLEPEGGCCNDCESVRQAYLNRGWAFSNPDAIEQCVAEHWVEKIKDQINEGCNVSGRVRVKKVATNMQFSPGRSYQSNYMHRHDLVPYLRDNAPHDFGHLIHEFRFESDDEYDISKFKIADRVRKRLGIDKNPLDGTQVHYRLYKLPSRAVAQFMFQYFVKIVGTQFNTMDNVPVTLLNAGRQDSRLRMHISSHQYSATSFVRDLGQQSHVTNEEGIELTHGFEAFPGLFMNLETSPMQIVHTEKRKPFAYFLTTFCAIIGGVLTVASLIDSAVFNTLNTVEDEQQRQRRSL